MQWWSSRDRMAQRWCLLALSILSILKPRVNSSSLNINLHNIIPALFRTTSWVTSLKLAERCIQVSTACGQHTLLLMPLTPNKVSDRCNIIPACTKHSRRDPVFPLLASAHFSNRMQKVPSVQGCPRRKQHWDSGSTSSASSWG